MKKTEAEEAAALLSSMDSYAEERKKNAQNEKRISELEKQASMLGKQVEKLMRLRDAPIHDFFVGNHIKIGALGDTGMGSLYENRMLLRAAYKAFKREGVEVVYHTGDLMEGEGVYRGQRYEIYVHGADNQVQHVIDKYPQEKGIITFFIFGGHDLSFKTRSGACKTLVATIETSRPDMKFLGSEQALVKLGGKYKIDLMLMHPGKGTAYALSYKLQKIIEAFSGGEKPDILGVGHFHKTEWIPGYRNVQGFQTGCIQHQTPYMKRNSIPAMQGFWIWDMTAGPKGISKIKAEFFPYYETKKFKPVSV